MFIKKKNIKNDEIKIVNVPTSDFVEVFVDNEILKIKTKDDKVFAFEFSTQTDAIYAQEKVFITLGLKSPYNNILDLTSLKSIETSMYVGLTLEQIASKLKIDPRTLAIVNDPQLQSFKIKEVNIGEETQYSDNEGGEE